MLLSRRLWLSMIVLVHLSCKAEDTLYLGGLFGLDTNNGGWNSGGIVPAVQMAIDEINNSSAILKDYRLELLIKDSQCNVGEAVRGMMEYISSGKPKIMFLGPGCSKAAIPVAEAIHYWNIVQIGFSNSSPLLSSKLDFPLYFRTNPSETFSNLGRLAILRRFKWKKVAILQQNNDVFTGISNPLVDLLKAENITVLAYESYKDHPRNAIENLKAFKQGFYGPKYTWILIAGRNEANWWKLQSPLVDCTPKEVRKGLSNNIGTGELKLSPEPWPTVSSKKPQELYDEYQARLKASPYTENTFASYGYDAVWTCALTLNASSEILKQRNIKLTDFNYNRSDIKDVFVDILKGISFRGMTGQVKFDQNQDRLTKLDVRQIQGDTERRVAFYDFETGKYKDDVQSSYQWEGGKVPVDGLTIEVKLEEISPVLFWFAVVLSTLGILMSISFLTYNIYNQDVRFIKMSSPNLNNLIIIGCILIYVAGVLFGLETGSRNVVCQAELWIATIGFSLAFGAMFSKTWRVHVIFLHADTAKRVIIRDRQLFGMVAILLLLDFIILLTWQIVDPIASHVQNLTLQVSSQDDTGTQPYVTLCSCKYITVWLVCMYAYKGLLLLFCAYLAWETRKVHIAALNDSKLIGLSVYNVIIPCVLVIPILGLVRDRPTAKFALTSFLTIFCTTFTLCFVFVPKMLFLKTDDGSVQSGSGTVLGAANVAGKAFVVPQEMTKEDERTS